jgi:hypothetical protein
VRNFPLVPISWRILYHSYAAHKEVVSRTSPGEIADSNIKSRLTPKPGKWNRPKIKCPVTRVISMGRRNTKLEPAWH